MARLARYWIARSRANRMLIRWSILGFPYHFPARLFSVRKAVSVLRFDFPRLQGPHRIARFSSSWFRLLIGYKEIYAESVKL